MDASTTTGNGTSADAGAMLDTSNQAAPIITVWVVMTTLAVVTVCMRFYTRRLILRILGPEDWLILAAMVLALGACVGFVRQTMFGLGHHIWTLTPESSKLWGIEQFYSFFLYTMSLACTKVSILFLYMRVMVHGAQRIAIYVVLGIVMICNIWVFITNFIQCIPLQALWDPEIKGSCLGLASTLGNSVMHIITDFIIFTLPIPTLAKLKINKKQKIGLLMVFSIGFFVCLISIIRLVSISRLDFTDVPYQFSLVAYWGAVEVNLAIICACLTTLKPLLTRLFPKLLGSTAEKTSQGGTLSHAGHRGTIGGTGTVSAAQRTRRTTLEERSFARLDDDSLKSDDEEPPSSSYEMEAGVGKDAFVAAPGKAYAGVHVSHRERRI